MTVVLAIEGWQTTSGLTIPSVMQRFRQTGNVTDRPRAGRPRTTGSYPDGRGNSRSVQLVHFVVI